MKFSLATQKWKRFELKIYLGLGLLVLALLPVLFYAFYSLSDIASQRKQVVLRHSEELILAERLGKELSSQHSLVPIYVLSGDPKLLAQLNESELRSISVIARLQALANTGEDQIALENIKKLALRMSNLVAKGARMKQTGLSVDRVRQYFSIAGSPISNELRYALTQFTDAKLVDLNTAKENLTKHTSNLIVGLVLVSLLAALSIAFITALLVRIVRAKEKADEEQDRIFLHEAHLSNARKDAVETVAHDLKSPLTAMKLRMELLKRKIAGKQLDFTAVDHEIDRLLRASGNMQRLIQDFLDHAKIEAGRLLLSYASCDPAAILRGVAENLTPLAQAKGQKINVTIADAVPAIECDADRVGQALENLVSNAIKFTPTGGTITLFALKNNCYIVFTVADTGPGIPQEKLSNIFERYWQDGSANRNGTGIGLAIVSGIAKAHGGNVFAESVLGKGTSIHLYIPALPEARILPTIVDKNFSHEPNLDPAHGASQALNRPAN